MWTTFALAVALTSGLGQADGLTITNVRATNGFLGAERANMKTLPGDTLFLAFDIEGIKVDETGKVRYNMSMQVTDSKDKVIYGQEPRDLEAFNTLGSSRLPAFTFVDIGFNQPSGEYTVKVTVRDLSTKATQSMTRKFEILEKDFGLVRLATSYDPNGNIPAPPGGVTGQTLTVNFAAVGFDRRKNEKQPDVSVEMRVLDEAGKPTVEKPFTGAVNKDVPENAVGIPMSFLLALNRPGKFTVELNAVDNVNKKTAKLTLPITVMEQKASAGSEK